MLCYYVLSLYPSEDVTVSNITNNSAIVIWNVASISSSQEYYVEYGEDENDLDQRSDSINVDNTSLIDQSYSVILTGLDVGTLYYVQVTTVARNVIFSSDVISFRTLQQGISNTELYNTENGSMTLVTENV